MKFDKLKPGMVLYTTRSFGGTQLRSWSVIKSKSSNMVIIDDYWEGSPPERRSHKDYNRTIEKGTWDRGYWPYGEFATYELVKKLIIILFKKS